MMERVAIPKWRGRISPVLDTARCLEIVQYGASERRSTVDVGPGDLSHRARLLCALHINTLLCGAVSRRLHDLLVAGGITVWPWLTGSVEEILAAYRNGSLHQERFLLPGCGRQRRRRRRSGIGKRHDTSATMEEE